MLKRLSLQDDEYYRYRARCCNCNFVCEWVVAKKNMEWDRFDKVTRDYYYPTFICWCGKCEEMAVYHLMAFSAESYGGGNDETETG